MTKTLRADKLIFYGSWDWLGKKPERNFLENAHVLASVIVT